MYNKAQLIGNVGSEPEIRNMQNGTEVARFSLATSERWKSANGEKQEKTTWHNIVIFGKLSTVVEKYVKKGDRLFIEGKIQNRKWQDKDGIDRYMTEIVITPHSGTMNMLSGKKDNVDNTPETYQNRENMDDDIPF